MGEMRYRQGSWCSSVLVKKYDVAQTTGFRAFDEVWQDHVSAIQPY